jgi:hypothetical protein
MTENKAELTASKKKKKLLDFIDKKVFDPILKAKADKYRGDKKTKLEDVQKKTINEQKQFHGLGSAKEVKKNYLSDVHSKAAVKVNRNLEELGLPTLPGFKDEFKKLCEELKI